MVVEIRRSINTAKRQMEDEMKEEFKMPEDIVQSLPKDEAIGKVADKESDKRIVLIEDTKLPLTEHTL